MSNAFLTRVWDHSRATGSELLVLLAIADHADESGFAFPGIARLAKKARISERSAQRAVQALEKLGELRVDRGGGKKSSSYWVLTTSDSVSPLPGQTTSPAVTTCHPRGDTSVTGVVTQLCHRGGDIAMSPEPSYNPHRTPKEGALARGIGAGPLPGNFDISEDVQTWAKSHGIDRLRDHLEAFKLKALAKGYLNVDWDAAFKRAVMEDWAKLRKDVVPSAVATKACGHCAVPLTGGSTRMRLVGDVCNSCWSAYQNNEWSPEIDARPVAKHAGKHEPERAGA